MNVLAWIAIYVFGVLFSFGFWDRDTKGKETDTTFKLAILWPIIVALVAPIALGNLFNFYFLKVWDKAQRKR